MQITADEIRVSVEAIRQGAPLVHNITNYVVMNTSANALLALGASPVMAHAIEEVEEMVDIAAALVINIGTLSAAWVEAMLRAAQRARERGIPVVLDPVGVGATTYRTRTAQDMLAQCPPTIIRGNASEIIALAGDGAGTKGVDSTDASGSALGAARRLHSDCGAVVSISGATDHIVGGEATIGIENGHVLMTRVTGLGCCATALTGAMAAVEPDPLRAAAAAMAVMGIAGEMAFERSDGPGTLQLHFVDALYNLDGDDIAARLRCGA